MESNNVHELKPKREGFLGSIEEVNGLMFPKITKEDYLRMYNSEAESLVTMKILNRLRNQFAIENNMSFKPIWGRYWRSQNGLIISQILPLLIVGSFIFALATKVYKPSLTFFVLGGCLLVDLIIFFLLFRGSRHREEIDQELISRMVHARHAGEDED